MAKKATSIVANANIEAVANAHGVKVSSKIQAIQDRLATLQAGEYNEEWIKATADAVGAPVAIVKIQATMAGHTLSRGRVAVATVETVGQALGSLGLDPNGDSTPQAVASELGLKTESLVAKILRDSFGRESKRGRTATPLELDALYRAYLGYIINCEPTMTRPHNAALTMACFAVVGTDVSQRVNAEFQAEKLETFAGVNFRKDLTALERVKTLLAEIDE